MSIMALDAMLTAVSAPAGAVENWQTVAAPEFEKSSFNNFWRTDDYRKLWTKPIEVEVLDLRKAGGGLEIMRRAGGFQAPGLALEGADGKSYNSRSANKNLTSVLPEESLEMVVAERVQDQNAASHPGVFAEEGTSSAPPQPQEEVVEAEEQDTVGRYLYWEKGINLTGPRDKIHLTIGGRAHYDFGSVDANQELQEAFPDLEGIHGGFRRLGVIFTGDWRGILEFKLEMDATDVGDVKDNWVRFLQGRYLPAFLFGHFKEPFSLDALTAGNSSTFMEVALPTRVFAPFRNMGVSASGTLRKKRMTWSAGFFLNSGSFSDLGDASGKLSEANGGNLTGRVTGLLSYQDEGRRLTHLGLSYSRAIRDEKEEDPSANFRSRPEVFLTDDRLIDTRNLFNSGKDMVSLEAAWMNGPFSLQGEYFHTFIDGVKRLDFNGWYVFGSWVVTGEDRRYRPLSGRFKGVRPEEEFNFRKKKWGALELALRYSQADLNDKGILGGKERNVTVGLNWYLTEKYRFMVNYINAKVKDRFDPPVKDGTAEIIAARIQIGF
jgi:phosphate-selective porin OprO/OprP